MRRGPSGGRRDVDCRAGDVGKVEMDVVGPAEEGEEPQRTRKSAKEQTHAVRKMHVSC